MIIRIHAGRKLTNVVLCADFDFGSNTTFSIQSYLLHAVHENVVSIHTESSIHVRVLHHRRVVWWFHQLDLIKSRAVLEKRQSAHMVTETACFQSSCLRHVTYNLSIPINVIKCMTSLCNTWSCCSLNPNVFGCIINYNTASAVLYYVNQQKAANG